MGRGACLFIVLAVSKAAVPAVVIVSKVSLSVPLKGKAGDRLPVPSLNGKTALSAEDHTVANKQPDQAPLCSGQGSSLPDQSKEEVSASPTVTLPKETCECRAQWSYRGVALYGCPLYAPDKDPLPWCPLDNVELCPSAGDSYFRCMPDISQNYTPAKPIPRDTEMESSREATAADALPCECEDSWSFLDTTFSRCPKFPADGDPSGPWCMVSAPGCAGSRGIRLNWMFCQPDESVESLSGNTVEEIPLILAAPALPDEPCECAERWHYLGNMIMGCPVLPLDDDIRPWCRVSKRSCEGAVEGGAYSYCTPNLSKSYISPKPWPRKDKGSSQHCGCALTWKFLDRQILRCPEFAVDGDPAGPWCKVHNSGCDGSRGIQLNWTYCTPAMNALDADKRSQRSPANEHRGGSRAFGPWLLMAAAAALTVMIGALRLYSLALVGDGVNSVGQNLVTGTGRRSVRSRRPDRTRHEPAEPRCDRKNR